MSTLYEIALSRIRQAAQSGDTALDLSHLGLTTLPPEIGRLTALTQLDLSWNQLTALPPEIGRLTALTQLDLSWNQLTALPPEIGALTALTALDLHINQLTALPPEIGRLTALTALDLHINQLTALPPEIGALTALTALDLRRNRLTALPPEIGGLTALTKLDLSDNQLTALPTEIGRLTALTWLNLRENRLTALPPEIGALTALTQLNLSGNQLTALPPEVWHLPHLTSLDISSNPFPELPPELWQKTDWQTLWLGGLRLTALPPEIGRLTALTALYLGSNRLTALPPELWHLPRLTSLDISSNPFPELPPELWQKTDWQMLGLGGLRLTALPPEIGRLTALTKLFLSDNQLTALPPEIGGLTKLTWLDLRDNQLTALPPEIGGLTKLTWLDLRDNQLTALPPEIGNLIQLTRLNLHGNPLALALPRALVESSNAQEIVRFYHAVWQAGQALGEARVLFIGQPAVGKTSLVYRLKDGSYQENRPSTMTVETHVLPLGEVTARLWDFGGQDFMHATHPLFFSARCVYVLALNVRQTYEQNRVEYWLRTIRAFGGDSPVIVVGNHADAEQHVLDLPQNRLKRDFPNIAAFLQTSAQDNHGIEALRAALREAVTSLPHVRVLFARPHLQVKAALEQEKQRRDIIPYERYRALCAAQDIHDEQDQDTLLALLHDLGVVLDFRNEDGEPLSPEGVLNPNWVTNAVYRLITDQELRTQTRGRLTPSMTRRILRDYQPHHRDLILKLLKKFELAYQAGDEAWYLPNAMPQDEPTSASDPDWSRALTIEYHYAELPESVITRFIVRSHEMMESGQVWRWGVILAWDENRNRALVRADPADKKITVHVGGAEHTRRDLLALIRAHFDAIHKTFRESAGEAAFPLQEFLCPPQYPGLRLEYQKLLTYEHDGLREIPETWQGRTILLNVTELLNGFGTPEARDEERKRLFPEEERMPRVIHYHEHKHFEARDVSNAVVNLGDGNQIQQSITVATPELQQTLQALTAAVQAMLPHLPAEQANEVRDDLQGLQEELAKPQPRKKWYSVSIEGLIQAAKNVGEVGAPVIELAGKLLTLLGR